MRFLSELDILPAYHKGIQNIARDFYLPCMDRAIKYDRAVAYFSSSIIIISWISLMDFLKRDGKIRLICSPFLSHKDLTAISDGYEGRDEEEIGILLKNQIIEMINNPNLVKPTKVLAS